MKKIIISMIIACLFIVSGICYAGDKEPEYELTFKVVYNSIPVSEIKTITNFVLRNNKDACKVEVNIKKPETVYSDSDSWIIVRDNVTDEYIKLP